MKKVTIFVLCMFAAFAAIAQDTIAGQRSDTNKALRQRPKVGVVLSGGGAKGFAHIGALRVIEEAGIPIDYIAGTSMGSIIGGLYAVGYDPDMMQKLCTEQDWNLIIKDQIPRKFMPLDKRINERHYLISFPLIDGKLKIRRSMIDGMYVNMLLTRLTMPAYKQRDFSKLPVPFLCIGTDMISADPIEFNSGSLAQSIRSSMSIPFLFEPVDYDGYLLCDGGLTNNFPVQNVRDKGADIIIGVDLEIIKSDPKVLDNSLKVLERLIAVVSQDKSNVAREQCDILIRPDIGKANMMSFNDFSPIINCGEAGAREKFPELKRLADSLQALGPFEVERHHTQPVDSVTIAGVEVEGVNEYEAELLKSEFGKEFPNEFAIDEIETIIVKTYSQGYYSNVWYELLYTPEGNIIKIHCKRKTSLNFNIAAHYDNNYGIGILLNMNARTKHFDYNVDLNLSDNPYFKARMLHRYTNFIRGGLELSAMNLKADLNTYQGSVFSLIRLRQNSGDVFLQIVPSVTQSIKLGFRMDYIMVKDKTYSELITQDEYEHQLYPKFYANYFFNNEDQTVYPRKGWNINVIGKCIMFDGVFSSDEARPSYCIQADIRKSFPVGQRHAFRLGAVTAARLGDMYLSGENMFYVGGQSNMYYVDNMLTFTGLPFVTVYTEYAAYGRTAWQWNFYKNFYAVASCDAGYFKNFMDIVNVEYGELETEEQFEEYIQLIDDLMSDRINTWFIPDNFIIGGGLALGVKTPLGPIEVQVSKSNVAKDWCLFVNVGYWF